MKKAILLTIASLAFGFGANAYDYTDDIYYNPRTETSSNKKVAKNNSGYSSNLVDFSTIDVDEYNRRGQYYYSAVDTIGSYVESEPDFIYTTQIQKYYNPTIVTDNADVLNEVLNNSYGNVEIVYNYNGSPSFVPYSYYNYPYYWNYYNTWYSPWSWNFNIGPFGFNFGWSSWYAWNPYWNWGPSWSWGPSWGWAWNRPTWHPGWGHGPHHPGWNPAPPRPMATYSPGGRNNYGFNGGGLSNNRGNTFNGSASQGGASRPGGVTANRRPAATTIQHGNNLGGSQAQSPSFSTTGRQPSTTVSNNSGSVNNVTRPSTGSAVRPGTGITTTPPSVSTNRPSTSVTSRPENTVTTRPSPGVSNNSNFNNTARPSTSTARPATTTTNTSRPANSSTTRPATTTTTRPSTSTTRPSTTTRQSTSTSTPARSTVGTGSRGGFSSGGRSSSGGGGGARGGRR